VEQAHLEHIRRPDAQIEYHEGVEKAHLKHIRRLEAQIAGLDAQIAGMAEIQKVGAVLLNHIHALEERLDGQGEGRSADVRKLAAQPGHTSGPRSADHFIELDFPVRPRVPYGSDGDPHADLLNLREPKVSIVVPVYNGAKYMREAIDSALAQTWPNTEIIVINDGSRDGGETDRIACSYGNRIRYISKPNGGVASALNAGLEAMTGDIFCWLSHDDMHTPDKTERQIKQWTAMDRPDVILYSNYRLIGADGTHIADVKLDHELLEQKPLYAVLRGSIHGCSVFIPRHLFGKAGSFDCARPTTQDYDLWFRMTEHARFVHMPETLVMSRWHDEQGSKKIDHRLEANAFWSGILEQVTESEQEAIEGSSYRFCKEMESFLRQNGITEAANHAAGLAEAAIDRVLVSVIIPAFNRPHQVITAVQSVMFQTHPNIELIVVDDGSTQDMSPLHLALEAHPKARVIRQDNRGPAAARNTGWASANGRYVAFLDSDDFLLPEKIGTQLRAMARDRKTFSHTSYWRHDATGEELRLTATGTFGGEKAFPEIIAGCSIATPTVMVERKVWSEELRFPEEIRIGEDVVLWIRLAARYGLQGIDRPLSIVRTTKSSSAYDREKQVIGIGNIIAAVEGDPVLARHVGEITRLKELRLEYSLCSVQRKPSSKERFK